MDVCRRFLGGESLTCAELLDHPPLSPRTGTQENLPDHLSSSASTLRGFRKAVVVILESRRKMLIPGKEVFRSMVATLLLTVLIEMVVIVFSMVVTP